MDQAEKRHKSRQLAQFSEDCLSFALRLLICWKRCQWQDRKWTRNGEVPELRVT
jgi:hypothetical protein